MHHDAGEARNTVLGVYTGLEDEGRRQLAQLLEVGHVRLELYPPEDPAVRVRIEREAVVIWRRG